MSKADRPTKLYFKGEYDATGQPLEFFGGVPSEYDPIPARDLDAEWLAGATEAQWKVLESDTGKRLYQKSDPTSRDTETAAIATANQTPDTASATTRRD